MAHDPQRRATSSESSIDLVRRARAGDRSALDLLFQRYVPPLRRWASGRLPHWAREMVDTDDMIQETLLKTFTNIDRFQVRHEGGLQVYMRQALRHRIVDELRKASRRPSAESMPEGQPHPGASPLEQAIGRQALDRYERALGRLDERDREAIVARIELGFDYGQIARDQDKPSPDAARMAVSRALVRLAREMDRD